MRDCVSIVGPGGCPDDLLKLGEIISRSITVKFVQQVLPETMAEVLGDLGRGDEISFTKCLEMDKAVLEMPFASENILTDKSLIIVQKVGFEFMYRYESAAMACCSSCSS